MKITVSIPTRGAAPFAEEVVRQYLEQAAKPADVRVFVGTDDDDEFWGRERRRAIEGASVIVSRAPREDALGDKWNRAIGSAPADVYVAGTDDGVVLTPGWDERVRECAALYQDGIGCIYMGESNAQLPMVQAVTHGWADAFGGLYPTHFPYWFIDMWLDELAMMTSRFVWADVQFTSAGGRGKTRGLRDLRFWNEFFDVTRAVREAQADAAIDEFYKGEPWMAWRLRGKGRQALRLMFQGRSHFIHSTSVQAEIEQATDAPEDERYLRIKARANAYVESLYAKAA